METGDRVLVVGGGIDSGIFIVNADDSVSRSIDADADTDFTTNKTVNIISGGSHAGATYAYTGSESPSVGSDVLVFEFKQGTNIGDGVITEGKLTVPLAGKINAKSDKSVVAVTTDASGYATVTHTLGSDKFIAQAWEAGEVVPSAEFTGRTVNTVVLGGVPLTEYEVILIG